MLNITAQTWRKTKDTNKFVLTTRLDEEVWFNSLSKHVLRPVAQRFNYREHIYGAHHSENSRKIYIDTYLQHNQAVRDFFADKPGSLIEVCWEKGDSWHELCSFLNLDIPTFPFPHKNADPGANKFSRRLKKRFASFVRRSIKEW